MFTSKTRPTSGDVTHPLYLVHFDPDRPMPSPVPTALAELWEEISEEIQSVNAWAEQGDSQFGNIVSHIANAAADFYVTHQRARWNAAVDSYLTQAAA